MTYRIARMPRSTGTPAVVSASLKPGGTLASSVVTKHSAVTMRSGASSRQWSGTSTTQQSTAAQRSVAQHRSDQVSTAQHSVDTDNRVTDSWGSHTCTKQTDRRERRSQVQSQSADRMHAFDPNDESDHSLSVMSD